MTTYPCLPGTPDTVPVVTPPMLLPVPPRPVREVEPVALTTAALFVAPKLLNPPNPELVADPKPVLGVKVDPKSVDAVVAALVLNSPPPRVKPVGALVPGVPTNVNPELCPA